MALKQDILGAVAANLREFGYPDATGENVATTKLFAMFGKDQVKEFGEKHADNAEVQAAVSEIVAEMDKAIDNG